MANKIEYRNLPYLLLMARETVLARFRPVISHFGLTEQQWRILRFLSDSGTTEQRDIASACGMLGPSLTGVLARMEVVGFILRNRQEEDQRRVDVQLSALGEKMVEALKPLILQQYRNLESAIGPEMVAELIDVLDRFLATDQLHIAQVALPPLAQIDPDIARLFE
jgi:homoprotocatechuate degradation regulator HpaR